MVSLNKVYIAGRLTRKPELRKTPNGMSVTDLLVALNREFYTLSGDRQQEVCFVDVVVWGKQADMCVRSLDCSSQVLVEGRLQLDVWYSREGEKRCKLRVAAERVQFVDRPRLTEGQTNGQSDLAEEGELTETTTGAFAFAGVGSEGS